MPLVGTCNAISSFARGYREEFRGILSAEPKTLPSSCHQPDTGDPSLPALGTNIDIRYDIPRYRIWQKGALAEHRLHIAELWRDDFVAFALVAHFLLRRRC
ncbi:MAG: hypothetical protein CM15mP84_06170 [Cellvibrionales bacterium]|nr:MAG: hypothetical protein CM15mP84_06170 [Cellvibrionales bacterium]